MLEGGRKLVVFGHHKEVLDAVSESLDNKVGTSHAMTTSSQGISSDIVVIVITLRAEVRVYSH